MKILSIVAMILLSSSVSAVELSEEFEDSSDKMKLYFAYAEFKMGNHPLAKLMWENIEGKGRGEANFNLGILHELGKGVPSSLALATKHYRLGAQLGSRSSAYQMGLMHFTEARLVSRDEATKWLTMAAMDGDESAMTLLQSMQKDQSDPLTDVRLTLAKGQYQKALMLLDSLQSQAEYRASALTRLGWMYEVGMGVDADLSKAAEYFAEAAELGNEEAMYAIAVMYLTGAGRPLNEEQGKQWMQRSAKLGYPKAIDKIRAMED